MDIAILVSDNGLGHMRRSIALAIKLKKYGYGVEIFGNKKAYKKITKSLNSENSIFKFKEYKFFYDLNYFLDGSPEKFLIIKRLPNLDNYDVVISDNIVEVLKKRKDSILIAQFFWHEILPNISKEYKKKCRELIKDTKPIIFGDKYFSMKYIKDNMNYIPTGLHELNLRREEVAFNKNCVKKNLLISGGNTLYAKNLFSGYVDSIIKKPIPDIDIVFLDKNIMPKKYPEWIQKANFNKTMYQSLIACICRPGIGTLTENIYYGVRIFTLYEKNNLEMINNDFALEKLDLGENLKSINYFKKQIFNFITDKERTELQISNCEMIDFDGTNQIIKKLLQIHKFINLF